MTQPTFIELCKKLIGSDHVITDPAKMLPFVTDYRKRFTGKALAAVFPGHTRQLASVVKCANCTRFRSVHKAAIPASYWAVFRESGKAICPFAETDEPDS